MNERETEFEPAPLPDCKSALELLQQRLDGEIVKASPAINDHIAVCRDCRERFAASQLLLTKLLRTQSPISPLFTERLVLGVSNDMQRQRRLRFAAYAATGLAASIAVVLWLNQPGGPTPSPTPAPIPEMVKEKSPAPPSLQREFTDAGQAVASLTRRAAGEAVDTGRQLVPDMVVPQWPAALDPATRSFEDAGQALADGFEPVTTSARRAARMFMRDFSLSDENKK